MVYELDIDSIFSFHPATPKTSGMHDDLRWVMREAAKHVQDNVPASAEKTLAIRHLQMAMMFANSAIAQHANEE